MNEETTQERPGEAVAPPRPPDAWAIIQRGHVVDVSLNKPRAPGDSGWEFYSKRGFSAPQPLFLGFPDLSPGVVAILLERERQTAQEGFTHENDDRYVNGELLKAAAVYLLKSAGIALLRLRPLWPWDVKWLKADDKDRNLEKAGALLVAEMDRRARSESRSRDSPLP